ncbi:MAG TPA: SpoIIE family protein phosphatase [Thermoleophilaceae bacterium]|nr:SpoIIE family protein phosphatase [Thermoleophilaceae bacterium]
MARASTAQRSFLLGLAITTAIAAVDAAEGARLIVIGLLIAGPLVAALGATARQTAIVSAYSLALGVLLGLPNDIFLETEHITRLLAVALGAGISVYVARLRGQRELDASRLRTQFAVAQVLYDEATLEAAAPRLLEAIGLSHGWDLGAYWEIREPATLRYVQGWHAPGVDPAGFDTGSRAFPMERGVGLPGQVWEREAPIWVSDVSVDPTFQRTELAARAGLRAAVAFPIVTPAEIVGVMELFTREFRAREPELLELTAALGVQIGEYVEAMRATEALRASEADKSAVVESALDSLITIDHEGRVTEFNPAAEKTFGYSREEALGREMAELIVPPSLRERHRAALRRYVETEEPTIIGRRLELTGMRADGSEFPVELALARIGDHSPPTVTGYLRDISERRHAEQEREELLRLEQHARIDADRAREQLEAILGGVADGVTAQAPDGSLLFANDAAVEVLGFDSKQELLAAPVTEIMRRFEVFDEEGRPFPLEQLPGRRALAGEPAGEALVRFRVVATGAERWSVVKSTPIFDSKRNVIMAINVFEDITEHKLAEQRARYLSESTRLLASSLDPDEVLRKVASLAVPELADWCVVDMTAEDGTLERVALVHADLERIERANRLRERYPPDPNSDTGVFRVMRTGQSELYPEIPDEMLEQAAVDDEHLSLLREFGLRSAMVVPLTIRGETIGAMSFVSGPSGRRFDRDDLQLAEELGRRCATAVENSRVYRERDYIARTLQTSLLPSELPHIPGVETAARFRATGAGNEVGGDFYDLFESGERGWTVVVGDVCGKGPDAAAITALARHTLRAAAMQQRLPSGSLRMLNEALLRQPGDRRFCTVAYAYLEALEGGARVGFASGGHPLPVVLRADGTVEWLGDHGMLLGVVPDPQLRDTSAALAAGDSLIFYTDGVTDAGGAKGPLGEEALAEIIASCSGLDANAIAARIEAAALEAEGGPPRDDIAVVVLRVAPGNHRNGA